jgi:Transport and Golgi organisation 2
VWPVDPVSGGTWIGANDAGLAMTMLNRTPRRRAATPAFPISRGTIIPRLLAAGTISAALHTFPRDGCSFQPFTLVMIQGDVIAVVWWNGKRSTVRRLPLERPRLFTSSSLGDAVVTPRRRALFSQLVLRGASPLRGQAAFHRHQWIDRPETSVLMSRPDAATVSRTVLDVSTRAIRMRYHSVSHQP